MTSKNGRLAFLVTEAIGCAMPMQSVIAICTGDDFGASRDTRGSEGSGFPTAWLGASIVIRYGSTHVRLELVYEET